MERTTLTIFAATIVLGITNLHAEPSPYEFKVASTEFTAFFLTDSSEPIVKKWAQKHRPKLYKIAYIETKKAEEKDKEGLGGLIFIGATMGARADLYLDYYLNHQAEDGWEPFIVEEKTIILRRKRDRG